MIPNPLDDPDFDDDLEDDDDTDEWGPCDDPDCPVCL